MIFEKVIVEDCVEKKNMMLIPFHPYLLVSLNSFYYKDILTELVPMPFLKLYVKKLIFVFRAENNYITSITCPNAKAIEVYAIPKVLGAFIN